MSIISNIFVPIPESPDSSAAKFISHCIQCYPFSLKNIIFEDKVGTTRTMYLHNFIEDLKPLFKTIPQHAQACQAFNLSLRNCYIWRHRFVTLTVVLIQKPITVHVVHILKDTL